MKKIIPHVSAFDCRDCLGVRRRKYTADWHTGFRTEFAVYPIVSVGGCRHFPYLYDTDFYRLVQKHNARIMAMKDKKVPFYQFFVRKNYLVIIL